MFDYIEEKYRDELYTEEGQRMDLAVEKDRRSRQMALRNLAIDFTEANHVASGNRVILLSSKRLMEMLYWSKYKVGLSDLKPPYESMLVLFPLDCVVDGALLTTCLINFNMLKGNDFVEFVEERFGMRIQDGRPGDKRIFIGTSGVGTTNYGTVGMLCEDDLNECMQSEEKMKGMINPLAMDASGNALSTERFEFTAKQEYVTMRVVMGLLVYLSAYPGKLIKGIDPKLREEVPGYDEMEPYVINEPEWVSGAGNVKTAHWRNGTWVTYMHPKYKRDDEGKPKIGYRRGTFVNLESELETVQG